MFSYIYQLIIQYFLTLDLCPKEKQFQFFGIENFLLIQ
ncbi:hypothetical protein pb186bvf_000206 [Paramecium bursaria]